MGSTIAFSIITPVLNESNGIREFLNHVREQAGGIPVEIIVVDGDTGGSTIREIEDGGITSMTAPCGRGAQMNAGAARASGAILLFLHADTHLPHGAFEAISEVLEDENIVGGAFDLSIGSDRHLLHLAARCASLKHRLTRVPYGDQAIFLRADFFHSIGGYLEIPLFEDVELMKRIRRLKKHIAILPNRVTTSPRKWESDGVCFTIIRNMVLQALFMAGVSPALLVKLYYRRAVSSHNPCTGRADTPGRHYSHD